MSERLPRVSLWLGSVRCLLRFQPDIYGQRRAQNIRHKTMRIDRQPRLLEDDADVTPPTGHGVAPQGEPAVGRPFEPFNFIE